MVVLALISIVYGALVSLMQKDMKKLIAYSSVSHMGFVMLGLFTFSPLAVKGAVLQMVNHGISTGALFLIVGVIYERRHTRLIAEFGGLSSRMPVYAAVFLIMAMSSIGLPGLNGFIGEFMILMGTWTGELGLGGDRRDRDHPRAPDTCSGSTSGSCSASSRIRPTSPSRI